MSDKIAASDSRLVYEETRFDVIFNGLLDIDSGIDEAVIKLRHFPIDGSVMLVAESYDDGVAAIALTKRQARAIGFYFMSLYK